jgi:hypothetical protein
MNTAPETATGTKTTETGTATGTTEQQALRARLEQLGAESIGGTGNYYRHNFPGILITDGARKLAELCEAFWFIDVIASWQYEAAKIPDPDFQCWKIQMTGENECNITCSDGNADRRTMQEIPFTDFPLPEGAELWAIPTADENGRRVLVIMHPREY